MPDWSAIYEQLEAADLTPRRSRAPSPVRGGDISAAWRLETASGDLFVKTSRPQFHEMYAAEADGLREIAAANTVAAPQVLAIGKTNADAFLVLEWLELTAPSAAVAARLGAELAEMHRANHAYVGWHRDNTIGLTPQSNTPCDNWCEFFADQRLSFQLRLAAENGHTGKLQEDGDRLFRRLPLFLDNGARTASLLHGDLWGGNWASHGGRPVIFDPATYYGDRESDLAMTRLFGGFDQAFYAAYESTWPLDAGHEARRDLYQLYHVLNHLNLFGGAYLDQALGLMKKLL